MGWALKRKHFPGAALAACALIYIFCPKPPLLEAYTYSRAAYDRNGELLHLSLSADDKYRLFVPYEEINDNTKRTLLLYEDKRFFRHGGVDLPSLMRAAGNMALGGRKQGASTLTMQTARLRFKLNTSTISGKIAQILRALQLERHYSKEEILEAYFNLCPLGGNIEGIGAAALIYFKTDAAKLNLPQSAALAVIPQNPGKRQPLKPAGQQEIAAAMQRLKTLWLEEYGDKQAADLDLMPSFERFLPKTAMHTVRRLERQFTAPRIASTLDAAWQRRLEEIISTYLAGRKNEGITNGAAMIVNYKTMEVLAEIGSADFFNADIQGQVDALTARRSPGSALKPFIYALALERGLIHPLTMLKDVPENYGLYTPENFDRGFKGLINATDALVQSRNIPAVGLLLKLNDDSFYTMLKTAGVPKLKPAKYYGLALTLGGAEVTMQNLAELYAMLGNFGEFRKLIYIHSQNTAAPLRLLTPESAFLTLEILKTNPATDRRNLPYIANNAKYETYWKTGTSYGFKDAWSAGIAGDYAVIVWLGNFDGTPNNALSGRTAAAPLMFQIIRELAAEGLVQQPQFNVSAMNLSETEICLATGELASPDCEQTGKTYFIPGITRAPYGNITRKIPIDKASGKRACRHTPPTTELRAFQFWSSDIYRIYEQAGIALKRPPDFLHDCATISGAANGRPPQIKYPADGSVFIFAGNGGKLALTASTDVDSKTVLWFINDRFIGKSGSDDTLETALPAGTATITAVDELGRASMVKITGRRQ